MSAEAWTAARAALAARQRQRLAGLVEAIARGNAFYRGKFAAAGVDAARVVAVGSMTIACVQRDADHTMRAVPIPEAIAALFRPPSPEASADKPAGSSPEASADEPE